MLAEHLTPEWTPSLDKPGYYQKTIHYGPATIIVRRPLLTPEEQAKRDAQVARAAEQFMLGVAKDKAAKQEVI